MVYILGNQSQHFDQKLLDALITVANMCYRKQFHRGQLFWLAQIRNVLILSHGQYQLGITSVHYLLGFACQVMANIPVPFILSVGHCTMFAEAMLRPLTMLAFCQFVRVWSSNIRCTTNLISESEYIFTSTLIRLSSFNGVSN